VAAYYLDAKEREGWPAARLGPLLEGLAQLLPWQHQWHGDVDPEFGVSMAAYYEDFVAAERRALAVAG
jgi:hypothetical protein